MATAGTVHPTQNASQQQMVAMQQPATQIVYVDQNGNRVAPPQQQVVTQIVYVDPNGNPVQPQQQQPQPTTLVPQSVQQSVVTPPGPPTYYQPTAVYDPNAPPPAYAPPENHQWVNDDEVPPDYESTIQSRNQAVAKNGRGCISACLGNPHMKATLLTVLFLAYLGLYIWCQVAGPQELCTCDSRYYDYSANSYRYYDVANCDSYGLSCDFPCSLNYKLGEWVFAILALLYTFYIIEAFWCSSSLKYLKNIHDGEGILDYIDKLQKTPPKIWWRVMCYHYQHTRDRNGKSRRKKVVTHRAAAFYQFATWRDDSMSKEGLDEYKLTKFSSLKTFTFANPQTQNHYNWHAQNFRDANNRDRYQTFTYGVEIEGFEPKILVENVPGSRGAMLSDTFYYVATLLGCTVCFRAYFGGQAGRKEYLFKKEISI